MKRATGGELRLEDAALYPALHRMEARGLIRSEWGQSENNRRAKYYALTRAGRKRLAHEVRAWQETSELMAAFLAPQRETQ